jgi:hypothetical protein
MGVGQTYLRSVSRIRLRFMRCKRKGPRDEHIYEKTLARIRSLARVPTEAQIEEPIKSEGNIREASNRKQTFTRGGNSKAEKEERGDESAPLATPRIR